MNDCPGCGMKIDTFNHADNCAFKKPEHLAELDGERQMTAPTIAEQIEFIKSRLSCCWAIDRPKFEAILASLEKLQSIDAAIQESKK